MTYAVFAAGSVSRVLTDTAEQFADDYRELFLAGLAATAYQKTDDTSARVAGQFWHTRGIRDAVFDAHGLRGLDARIAKTLAKSAELLTVLSHPEVPLHNNDSELGARVRARRRAVSLHSKSQRGRGRWTSSRR